MKERILALMFISVFTVCLCLPSAGAMVEQEQAQVFVNPALTTKSSEDVGSSFEVSLSVMEVSDLQGFDFNLTWNDRLLTLTNVDFTPELNSLWGSGHWFEAMNSTGAGSYKIVAVSTAAGFTGDAPLANLTFRVENPGSGILRETLLHFQTHKLSDSHYSSIAHTVADGTYRITGGTPLGCDVYFQPSSVAKTHSDVGTCFNLTVKVLNITDMYGFDFNVTWNNSLLTFNECYCNDTLDALWGSGSWFLAKNETGPGWFKIVAVSTRAGFSTAGSQALFELEFRVEDPQTNFPRQSNIQFATHKLSDSNWQSISHTAETGTYSIAGETPTLKTEPESLTCRIYGETFEVAFVVSEGYEVTGFAFETHYNTTLLNYAGVNWNAWNSGTITFDDTNGIVAGSTSGLAVNGTRTLVTVQFRVIYQHVWKDETTVIGWKNDQSGLVYVQSANLSYSGGSELGYLRGGSQNQINVGPDVNCTFSPIQGDVNNDGTVDITDLRTVAAYFMVKQGEPRWTEASTYDLNGDAIIDILDLRTIAQNYGFTYP